MRVPSHSEVSAAGVPPPPDALVVRSSKEAVRAIEFPAVAKQAERALEVEPQHAVAVLVPCAATKPFSEAPSHQHGYLPALSGLPVDLWVVSEPLGLIPYDWIHRWPNASYDFPPEHLKGTARDLLVARVRGWLEGVARQYKAVFLALTGHHMALIEDASIGLELDLTDVSISACRRTLEACSERDFRATSSRYREFLRSAVREVTG